MSRYARAVVEMPEWVDVSPGRPCPVCRATSGCSLLENEEFARCLNVVCDWPVLAGGWLHPLAAQDQEIPALV